MSFATPYAPMHPLQLDISDCDAWLMNCDVEAAKAHKNLRKIILNRVSERLMSSTADPTNIGIVRCTVSVATIVAVSAGVEI